MTRSSWPGAVFSHLKSDAAPEASSVPFPPRHGSSLLIDIKPFEEFDILQWGEDFSIEFTAEIDIFYCSIVEFYLQLIAAKIFDGFDMDQHPFLSR
jgi:hypothetical protein